MNVTPVLRDAALRWIANDIDPDAQAELQAVLASATAGDAAATADLADRMAGPLMFGTAGLRAPVRAGPNGMNRTVVVRTTAGIAEWLLARGHHSRTVVVGRDARHGSAAFAEDTAAVLSAAGFAVRTLPEPLPTPVLAFAARQLGAVAAVQITASHNPPSDNGYKLYDDTGTQIAPPADREIEATIATTPAAPSVPRATGWTVLDDDIVRKYLDRVAGLASGCTRDLRIALTPMHGVGGPCAIQALRQAGFTDVHTVETQFGQDPDFPTVPNPNPEEPGATDALLDLAESVQADLAIALDPDADRCAVGIPEPHGSFRMLRGDETGVLLGNHIMSTLDRSVQPDPLVATTIVSSSMLQSLAHAHGLRHAETLTGFKWLMRAGDGLVYAYEEALGLCVDPGTVRDKDGISAAVLAADLAATLKADGRTLRGTLDDLAVAHGVHLTDQVLVTVDASKRIDELMAQLRENPPRTLAHVPVQVEDLRPRANVLRLTGHGLRLIARPSGTEPKLKAYLEVVQPVPSADSLDAARRAASNTLDSLHQDLHSLLPGV